MLNFPRPANWKQAYVQHSNALHNQDTLYNQNQWKIMFDSSSSQDTFTGSQKCHFGNCIVILKTEARLLVTPSGYVTRNTSWEKVDSTLEQGRIQDSSWASLEEREERERGKVPRQEVIAHCKATSKTSKINSSYLISPLKSCIDPKQTLCLELGHSEY